MTAPHSIAFEQGSFRDRECRVVVSEAGVFRLLNERGAATWRLVSQTKFYRELLNTGIVIPSRELSANEQDCFDWPVTPSVVLQHDRVPFVSYPYEWSFEMLRQAALVHLTILAKAVSEGFILKDASPFNVQFIGTRAVFIDVGSFTPLSPGEPWSAYRQFCEMMLFPLLLQAYRAIDFQPILRGNLEGISSRRFLQSLSFRDMFRSGVFTHGWLQTMLDVQTRQVASSTVTDLQKSGFGVELILHNIAKLTRLVSRLKWTPPKTQWSNYRTEPAHVLSDAEAKSAFIQDVCRQRRRSLVWDLGCNDGTFSRIAACDADFVLAIDSDHGCIERLYKSLVDEQKKAEAALPLKNILPACIDLANPSPGLGWRGRERKRLEERGRPDLVLCLGLIHHLVIACNIPLPEVVEWLAYLQGDVVIEFPSRKDAMVQMLLRNKRDQYDDYSLDELERCLSQHFTILRRARLPSGERTLIHATVSQN